MPGDLSGFVGGGFRLLASELALSGGVCWLFFLGRLFCFFASRSCFLLCFLVEAVDVKDILADCLKNASDKEFLGYVSRNKKR